MPEIDRRDFLKIAGMTAGAAATVACREPVHKIIPYLNQPDEITPGIATYYNSTCRECPGACGIRVKTREGRPIKVDGNPDHPLSKGKLCVRGEFGAHAHLRHRALPGPDEARRRRRAAAHAREDRLGRGHDAARRGAAQGREQDRVSRRRGHRHAGRACSIRCSRPSARRAGCASSRSRTRRCAARNQLVFGSDAVPQFKIGAADVLIAFGTDFIETWLTPLSNQVDFIESRKNGKGFAIFVGPRLGLSGSNTDQWLAPNPGTEVLVALALASEVAKKKGGGPEALRGLLAQAHPRVRRREDGHPQATLEGVAARIAAANAPLALPPGIEVQGTNAARFAAAVQILNVVSGAVGKTVVFGPDHNLASSRASRSSPSSSARCAAARSACCSCTPRTPRTARRRSGLADALRSGNVFTVSFASAPDETSELADLVLPDNMPFESWGDAEPVRGVKSLQQPTVRPLFDTRQTVDVMLDAARALGANVPAGSFRELLDAAWGGKASFDVALGRGGEWKEVAARVRRSRRRGLHRLRARAARGQRGGPGARRVPVAPSVRRQAVARAGAARDSGPGHQDHVGQLRRAEQRDRGCARRRDGRRARDLDRRRQAASHCVSRTTRSARASSRSRSAAAACRATRTRRSSRTRTGSAT